MPATFMVSDQRGDIEQAECQTMLLTSTRSADSPTESDALPPVGDNL